MLQILERRFPGLHIRLYPALVQGEGSIEEVCQGIEYFSQSGWAEVVIVARGGGSLEDLWTFNEEAVARAIAACAVPVISAIGHETDFTIADFVADVRAPTPSAAAEIVICSREQLLEGIATAVYKLRQAARYRLADAARRLQRLGVDRAASLLSRHIGRSLQRVDELDYRLRERTRACVESCQRRLRGLSERLRGSGSAASIRGRAATAGDRLRGQRTTHHHAAGAGARAAGSAHRAARRIEPATGAGSRLRHRPG